MQRFTALRTVFTQQTNELFDVIGLEALRANAGRTRRGIERSPFTKGVRGAMDGVLHVDPPAISTTPAPQRSRSTT